MLVYKSLIFFLLFSSGELVPLGFLPVLTTPCGKKISQTTAIIRYVASELNLFGKSNVERAVIDSTIVCNKEIGDMLVDVKYCDDNNIHKKVKCLSKPKIREFHHPPN